MKKILLSLICFYLGADLVLSQNTVGTILNTEDALDGYVLFTANGNEPPNLTYLINNCGEIVHQWESEFPGFGADRLMEDGSLYRAAQKNETTLAYFGITGRLEHFDWEGNLLWAFDYSEDDFSMHHDYTVLPNGNVLLMVAQRMSLSEAIQAGRDPDSLWQDELYTEKIIEIEPQGANGGVIVWEWDFWDHLVQDFDAAKDNFGIVANNPGRLDINFVSLNSNTDQSNADWIHLNGIEYNEDLDQIILSARGTSEIYIIDHSTTTEEAATNSGGNSGKGGNFLYRWGNPQAYGRGTEASQIFSGQHSAHWIPEGLPNEGKLMVFNNGSDRLYSSVDIVDQPIPDANGNYSLSNGVAWGPENAIIRYQNESNPEDFFSPIVSSAYTLPNGNVIVDCGSEGRFFEVDQDNTIVWEYINPVTLDGTLSQGETLPQNANNRVFRVRKYDTDYPAFENQDLEPGIQVEENPIPENCELFLSIEDRTLKAKISLYPNPANDYFKVSSTETIRKIQVFNLNGALLMSHSEERTINISDLPIGLYLVKVNSKFGSDVLKLLKN